VHLTDESIADFFTESLADLKCQDDTRAYIISIFAKFKNSSDDLSKCSLTLRLAQAHEKQNFSIYQNIGDYLFFVNSIAPQYLTGASQDYYDSLASVSYYSCYNLIKRQWHLYYELANEFTPLYKQARSSFERRNLSLR
jgi:hypothetical protein